MGRQQKSRSNWEEAGGCGRALALFERYYHQAATGYHIWSSYAAKSKDLAVVVLLWNAI
jgi:hypothetical protein